ncbi:hypothetical protein DDZ18_12790 [Marinicauda salina]|uniref:Exopolysaccharide biosynthesis protein n=1 Tax=Marinicauda salina TaxID=2135793 RepID=A0A2U2BRJ3_9PROT|nr:exopolysaccharide biosynthesis protein [Marinicauda salina]PWE16633.1 hypothetical protein DDZ18_12790 [Marinicauda salina]
MTNTAGRGPRGDDAATLEEIFEDILRAETGERITVDDILAGLEHRSFGPLLLIPTLLAIMPIIGALPGVSYGMGFLALFISIQFAVSAPKLWLPRRIRRVSFHRKSFERGVEKAKPWLRRVDRLILPRFHIAFQEPMPRLVALLCVALSLLMVIYATVPGGVVIPALALLLIALALTTHDGLLLLLGVGASVAAITGTVWLAMRVF